MSADAWTEITASSDPKLDNVRRADPKHALEFRRGKDFQGRCLFILDGELEKGELRQPPRIEGIDTIIELGSGSSYRLRMALLDRIDVDLFHALTMDLMSVTWDFKASESHKALLLVIDRLGRWQRLFRNRRSGLLSPSEVLGLAGELLFLKDCLIDRLQPHHAISAWRGPYGDEQDFVINGAIFEVKTQLSTSDARLLISSENQLDPASGEISVVHQRLSVSDSRPTGSFTLNDIVMEVRALIEASDAASESFDVGLSEVGYFENPEYDSTTWHLTERAFFLVRPGFPSLLPSNLPPGISSVRYMVSLAACQPFAIDGAAYLDKVING